MRYCAIPRLPLCSYGSRVSRHATSALIGWGCFWEPEAAVFAARIGCRATRPGACARCPKHADDPKKPRNSGAYSHWRRSACDECAILNTLLACWMWGMGRYNHFKAGSDGGLERHISMRGGTRWGKPGAFLLRHRWFLSFFVAVYPKYHTRATLWGAAIMLGCVLGRRNR